MTLPGVGSKIVATDSGEGSSLVLATEFVAVLFSTAENSSIIAFWPVYVHPAENATATVAFPARETVRCACGISVLLQRRKSNVGCVFI